MSDKISIDFSDFDRLAADLAEAPEEAKRNIPKALEYTARNVRDGWRGRLEASPGLEGLPYAITYDIDKNTVFGVDEYRAEIGADKSRNQGPLANISEFGSIKHPPRGYGLASLQEQQADFEKGLGIAIGDIL